MPALSARTAHAMIPVADMSRAKGWYQQKLGLKPSAENEFGANYELGGGTGFVLYPTKEAGKAPNTLFCFDSTDVEADVAQLKKQGVTFEDYNLPDLKTVNSIATFGAAKGAWFRDSEGNILSISNVTF
jgi:catechol 2,3-dioxygenase-like lactoylglutathione lyase family enzyme